MVFALVVGAACSSGSGAAEQPTAGSTALVVPPPFEVGQQVGLGDVTIQATSFRHRGDALTVVVSATSETTQPLSIDPEATFSIFYGPGRHPPTRVTGEDGSPKQRETLRLDFVVPSQYQYPLLWFRSAVAGTQAATIVLRGSGSTA